MFDGAAEMMGNYVLKYVHYLQRNVNVGFVGDGSLHLWYALQHNFCPLFIYINWALRSHTVEQNKDIMNISYVFIFRFLEMFGSNTHTLNVFNVPNGGKRYSIFYFPLCARLLVVCCVLCLWFAMVLLTDFPGIYELI